MLPLGLLLLIAFLAMIVSTKVGIIKHRQSRRPYLVLGALLIVVLIYTYLSTTDDLRASISRQNGLDTSRYKPNRSKSLAATESRSGLTVQPTDSKKSSWPEVPYKQTEVTSERRSPDGGQRNTFTTKYADSTVPVELMVLVVARRLSDWGLTSSRENREFVDFLAMIKKQDYEPKKISISVTVEGEDVFSGYTRILQNRDLGVAKVDLILLGRDDVVKGGDRAFYKNLMTKRIVRASIEEGLKGVVWLEPDVIDMPEGLFTRMERVTGESVKNFDVKKFDREPLRDAGLITLAARGRLSEDLSRVGWTGPTKSELKKNQKSLEPIHRWAKPLSYIVQDTQDDELVKLDGVGETVLYIKADLIRAGLNFPADDERDEYGGLCFQARGMILDCYGLGGSWVARLAD